MSAIVPKRHLYKTLQAHWRSFLADLESDGDSSALPAFVVSEVEAFLRWKLGAWLRPREVPRMRLVPRCRVLVSAPRILPELYRTSDV